jgi:hypothetical protein
MVDFIDYGLFQSKPELLTLLQQLSYSVNQAPIEQEQEGAVIYFESDTKNINLCKLKTLEYRIYRKLREKLKR